MTTRQQIEQTTEQAHECLAAVRLAVDRLLGAADGDDLQRDEAKWLLGVVGGAVGRLRDSMQPETRETFVMVAAHLNLTHRVRFGVMPGKSDQFAASAHDAAVAVGHLGIQLVAATLRRIPDAKLDRMPCVPAALRSELWPSDLSAIIDREEALAIERLESKKPGEIISAKVAVQRYHVTKKTLSEALDDGRLTDHRPPGHARNAELRLDDAELARNWAKKVQS